MRQRSRGRVTLAAAAAMFAVAALPGQALAADGAVPYTFDPKASAVSGAEVNTDATELKTGSVYKSSIKVGEKLYYRLNLDAKTNAYVSAVVVPKDGGKVAYGDGVEVSIRSSSDQQCSSRDARFESAEYPRPIAAYASRLVNEDNTSCQDAGTYYFLVERTSKETSSPADWDLELRYMSEPQVAKAGSLPTGAPENWPSASPAPPSPAADNRRHGGTSYYDATSLETGEWRDEIAPGQTLFYRVPVDWGQQIFATARMSNTTVPGADTYVSSALAMALDNPAQGHVDNVSPLSYSGKPASVSLDPLPPVAYANRFDSDSGVSAMRFAGWYYLSVTLNPEIGKAYGTKPMPLTLAVKVDGTPKETPYAGDAGIFGVTQHDKNMARNGQSGPQAAASESSTMKLVAAAGIGAGTVLVLWMGVWTLIARRRAAAAANGPAAGAQQYPYGGPPQAW